MSDPVVNVAKYLRNTAHPQDKVIAYKLRPAQPALGFYALRAIPAVSNQASLMNALSSTGNNFIITQKNWTIELPKHRKLLASEGDYLIFALQAQQ